MTPCLGCGEYYPSLKKGAGETIGTIEAGMPPRKVIDDCGDSLRSR